MTWSATQRCEFDEFDTKSVVLHIFARITATWVEPSRSKKRSIPAPAILTLLDAGGLKVGTEPEDRGWSGEHSPAWTIYRACRTAAAISAMKRGGRTAAAIELSNVAPPQGGRPCGYRVLLTYTGARYATNASTGPWLGRAARDRSIGSSRTTKSRAARLPWWPGARVHASPASGTSRRFLVDRTPAAAGSISAS